MSSNASVFTYSERTIVKFTPQDAITRCREKLIANRQGSEVCIDAIKKYTDWSTVCLTTEQLSNLVEQLYTDTLFYNN